MGNFQSGLSTQQKNVLQHSTGMKVDEIRPIFGKIPIRIYYDIESFNSHRIPNSLAFRVHRDNSIMNVKHYYKGKTYYF
jgi:hypothetical protein